MYAKQLKHHLANYKRFTLGIRANGKWSKNHKPYAHILPEAKKGSNILQPYRHAFWQWLNTRSIKLRTDFHHLNSSQAMAFNLFFPLVSEGEKGERGKAVLPSVLGLPKDDPIDICEFEKVFPKQEGETWQEDTKFDFYIKLSSGTQVFFELKLAEQDFGRKAKPSEKAQQKWEELYVDRLRGKVDDRYLDMETGFKHYEILRNMSYIDPDGSDRLIFIFPKRNKALEQADLDIREIASTYLSDKVSIVYLEDLAKTIRVKSDLLGKKFTDHYKEFSVKYII
jgi:hypothetical protein